jgi:hypothetical protein
VAMVGDEFSDCTGMTTDNEPTDQFADQSAIKYQQRTYFGSRERRKVRGT